MEKEENKKTKNVAIETFAEDMAKVVESNEIGIVKKILEEQEKNEASDKKESTKMPKSKVFFFLGIFFTVLAFVAVFSVYFFRKQIFTVEVKPQYAPIIFIDKTQFKEISGLKKDQITQTILNEANTAEFKSGGIEAIFPTADKQTLGFRAFLNSIEANLDQTKIEFIDDNFLIGATNKGGRGLFMLLKMRSIPDVFDVMRSWESKMFLDLHGMFGVNLNNDTKYLLTKDFEDGIIQNKNARILRDNDGKILMMYVYIGDDALIITNSEIATGEVMLRLASSKIKK